MSKTPKDRIELDRAVPDFLGAEHIIDVDDVAVYLMVQRSHERYSIRHRSRR